MPPKANKPAATAAASKRSASTKKGSVAAATKNKKASAADVAEAVPQEVVEGREIWLATDALQKTKAMRNYFQLERDRIISFWDITKQELEELKERLRQKQQEKAELADRQEVEKKVFKQKIRHLLYENQMQLAKLTEEAERTLMEKEDEYRAQELNAHRDVRDVKLVDRELEVKQREQQRLLVEQQDKAIAEQQAKFEREVKEIHLKYEHLMRTVREEMDEERREEIRQIEKRKEQHVEELRQVHERTYKELKDYYSEITSNNLESIRTLKDEVYARKRTEAHNEKAMYEVARRNKKLTEPLAKLQRQKKELESEVATYLADKERLQQLKGEVREAEQEYQTLSWEHEVLSQRYAKLVEDRDIILKKYKSMLQDIQRKSAFRRVLVEKKIELVQNQLEGRDAKLTELLKRANINPEDIKELQQKIHDLLSEKDKTIEDLKLLLLQMTERNEDIIGTYETYLQENGASGLSGASARV